MTIGEFRKCINSKLGKCKYSDRILKVKVENFSQYRSGFLRKSLFIVSICLKCTPRNIDNPVIDTDVMVKWAFVNLTTEERKCLYNINVNYEYSET